MNGMPSLPIPGMNDMLDGFREGGQLLAQEAARRTDHMLALLEDIRTGIDNLDVQENTRLVRQPAAIAADGSLDLSFGRPRVGFDWEVQRATFNVPGGGAVPATLFRGDIGPGDAVAKLADVRDWVDTFGGIPIYVPQSVPLRMLATGGTPAAAAVVTLQVVEYKAKGGGSSE